MALRQVQATQRTRSAIPFKGSTVAVRPALHKASRLQTRAFGLDVSPDPEAVLTGTYVALGLGALSFVGTFFIAPKLKDTTKDAIDWKEMFQELTRSGGVRTVSAKDAYGKAKKGSVLLDVRMQSKFDEARPEGAVGVPLYQPIEGWDIYSNLRRIGFAFFGIYGTEMNMNFVNEVEQAVPKGKEIMVICEMGGSLEPKPGAPFAFQSRALKAIYYLKKAGFKNISLVQGGTAQWTRDGLPYEA